MLLNVVIAMCLPLLCSWSGAGAEVGAGAASACYWSSACAYELYGSKTPYAAVRGDARDGPVITGCDAESVWLLARHGARHPGADDTDAMRRAAAMRTRILAAHANARGRLCHQDVEDLRDWAWDSFLDNTTSYLTDIGFQELKQLGRRLKAKYPNLVSNDPGKVYFRPTEEQRTVASAQAFVEGLTEGIPVEVRIDHPRKSDCVIRSYKICPKYERIKNTYPTPDDHVQEFYTTPEFRLTIQEVEERIGLKKELTPEKIIALYNLCRFYRSFAINRRSPWCSIFSNANLATLEYVEDIRHYYKNGYGAGVNCQLGATALKDLYDKFEAVSEGVGQSFVGYFTHDTMMEMVFCAMGLFRDDFEVSGARREPSRKWRTSLISPFATNLMAVMYKCRLAAESPAERVVQFFLNERPLALPECAGADGACSWDQFRDKFGPYANTTLEFCALSDQQLSE